MIQQHGRPRAGDLAAEVVDVGLRIVEGELDALGDARGVGLQSAGERHAPGVLVGHHLADGFAQHRAGPAEGHVADELLPHQLLDVVEGFDVEAGVAPDVCDLFQPLAHRAFHLA